MRSALWCATLVVVASALVACDTTQPLQGGSVEASVDIATSPDVVPEADIWEVWQDTNNDQVPDQPVRDPAPNGPIVHSCADTGTSSTVPYPWSIAVELSVLRKGSTVAELLSTTSTEATPFSGVTRLDTTSTPVPDQPLAGNLYLVNGRRVTYAHADYLTFCTADVPTAGSLGDLPNPAVIPLNPGDTLIVQARKATFNDNRIFNGAFPNPILEATILVNGVSVSTRGTSQSTRDDGDGISISYTLN